MKTSDAGIALLKNFEGLRLEAYRDAVGVWTIGYGHASAFPGQKITEERAEGLLRFDLERFERAVENAVMVPLTQEQFDSLVSFSFNVGAGAFERSTLLKKLNAGDYAGAQEQFGLWVSAGGRKLAGLVKRREAEAKLFGGKI